MNFDGTELIPAQGCWCTCQLELNCVHMWCTVVLYALLVIRTCYKQCSMNTSLVVRPSPFCFFLLLFFGLHMDAEERWKAWAHSSREWTQDGW